MKGHSPRMVMIGAIAGSYGVRGEVRIKSFTATPEDIFDYAPFRDETGAIFLTIQSWKHVKDGFAAYAVEITSREEAQGLKSARLYARRDVLPALAEEEYYHADLVGLLVRDLNNQPLGQVRAVQNFGAGDLLEVHKTPGAKGAWYLPFTLESAPHVDLAKGEVIADPPDGLIPTDEHDRPPPKAKSSS